MQKLLEQLHSTSVPDGEDSFPTHRQMQLGDGLKLTAREVDEDPEIPDVPPLMKEYAIGIAEQLNDKDSVLYKQVAGGDLEIKPPLGRSQECNPEDFHIVPLIAWAPTLNPTWRDYLANGVLPCPRCKGTDTTKNGGFRTDYPFRRVVTMDHWYGLMGKLYQPCMRACAHVRVKESV